MPKGKSKTRRSFSYGSVFLRPRGKSWTIDYRDENGKRIQRAVPEAVTIEDAVFALQQKVGKVFEIRHRAKPRKEVGFMAFASIFLDDCMAVSRRNYRSDIYRLETLKAFFKDTNLRDITPLEVERFRKSRLKAGNSRSTCNRYLALLKRLFTIAIQEGYCEENPVKKLKLFSEKDTLKERILTEEEEGQLLDASSEHLRSILIAALNTGARIGEILSLTWSQIDFAGKVLRIEKTKSGRLRYIPINSVLLHELEALKNRNGQSPYIFVNPKTGKPFTTVQKAFYGACRRAGIKGLRIHDIRHSFATRLAQRGADISTLQSLLGHSNISTTQRYLHSSNERKRQLVELLGKSETGDTAVTMDKTSSLIR